MTDTATTAQKCREVLWHTKAKTEQRLHSLIRKAAQHLGWDPDFVLGMVEEHGDAYNTREFGWQITWWADGDLDLYMYTRI